MAVRERLGIGHIESGHRDLIAVESIDQSVLVDKRSPRDVDEVHSMLHAGEARAAISRRVAAVAGAAITRWSDAAKRSSRAGTSVMPGNGEGADVRR